MSNKAVLIPSFSGLWLVGFRAGMNWNAVVLIPSFSGLWLVTQGTEDDGHRKGLNPFFFRSLVGPELSFEIQGDPRLNPFFFRSLVGRGSDMTTIDKFGLNPFFFRSLVGRRCAAPS